jgi:hypothetical protein
MRILNLEDFDWGPGQLVFKRNKCIANVWF